MPIILLIGLILIYLFVSLISGHIKQVKKEGKIISFKTVMFFIGELAILFFILWVVIALKTFSF